MKLSFEKCTFCNMEHNGEEQDSIEKPLMVTASRKAMPNLFSERNLVL